MDNLSHKFIEEATELLEKLENALFVLEDQPENAEQIDEVFRVMHTLKGSGAMFGFEQLSTFTHELESIYDKVRNGKLPVTKALLDKTFHSIDLIRSLLSLDVDTSVWQQAKTFIENLQVEFLHKDIEGVTNKLIAETKPIQSKATSKAIAATWFIHFEPNKQILKQGSRPLFLLDELFEAGECKAFLHTDHLPELEKLDPENAYFYWDILLSTTMDENHLRDIFVFVEDDSNLSFQKIDNRDWLSHPRFEEQVRLLDFYSFIDETQLDKMKSALFDTQQDYVEPREIKNIPENEEIDSTLSNEILPEKAEVVTSLKRKSEQKQKGASTIRIASEKLDILLNLISEMVTIQARLEHYEAEKHDPALEAIVESYQKLSYQLRENALEMRLVPFYTILTRFKRLVRNLSEELQKEVKFVTKGTETELDKSMIEKLYDPVMHILRNSIDHGIENPEERIKSGKPKQGLVQIDTYNSGASVVIEVTDDGRGIDLARVREKAIQKGWINANDQVSETELMDFIFRPGFSTAQKLSDVSGRGVGMDVVKKNIADLRGEVELISKTGEGTTVRIVLPLTLSIIDGLLVFIGKTRYIIPLDNIKHVYEMKEGELKEGFKPVLVKGNRQIPYINLIDEFKEDSSNGQRQHVVVLHYNEKEMGVIINDIVGNYQAVIKPMGKFIQQKEFFSGASILGDGEVALVMDTNRIINQFINE